jgi:oleate hydratase
MKNYDRIRARKPEGIEERRAYIVGGGIAGLATAVFLIDDGYMPGKNVTIYEQLRDVGGSMDGTKNERGYLCRGERELEPNMECLWYLCGKIPSIDTPERTVLEETVDANIEDHINIQARVLEKQGKVYEKISDFRMSERLTAKFIEMMTTPEEELQDLNIEDFYGDTAGELFKSSLWICFHSMLAFKHYHSLIEMKRYMIRFIHHTPGIEHLRGVLHTKYNEYDSVIKPIIAWLQGKGVAIVTDCVVFDLDMDVACNTVQAILARKGGVEIKIPVLGSDLVIVTNGSMTQNSSFGDNTTVARTNRDMKDRGAFTLWESLARKKSKFGHPEKFISDIDKTKWMSVFPTIKGYPQFFRRLQDSYGYHAGKTSGAITILDSSWDISLVLYPKYFPDQGDDTDVFWFDGLYGENTGDYIKNPMAECTGEEIMTELLYHLGMLDIKEDLLKRTYFSTAMLPYITSQFMPRRLGDRPSLVPEGCTNLAFIGQYVELPGDVVFTVETSVRTALTAAYKLLKLDRPIMPLYEGQYDIRHLVANLKKMLGKDKIERSDLPLINPLKINKDIDRLLEFVNDVPSLSELDTIY